MKFSLTQLLKAIVCPILLLCFTSTYATNCTCPVAVPLIGSYTVGGTAPDFNDLPEVISCILSNGILGEVTFNIRSGAYEQSTLALSVVLGSSEINKIIFQAENQDATSVVLRSTGGSIFTLVDNSYTEFRHLTFEQTTGLGIHFQQNAHHITIEDCLFTNDTGSHIELSKPAHNNTIRNNRFVGGREGIYSVDCTFGNERSANNNIEGNTLHNVLFPIEMNCQEGLQIQNNTITGEAAYGIRIINTLATNISDNQIKVIGEDNSFTQHGIVVVFTPNSASNPTIIANNFIHLTKKYVNGIWMVGEDYTHVYHNTVVINGILEGTFLELDGLKFSNIMNNNWINLTTTNDPFILDDDLVDNQINYNNYFFKNAPDFSIDDIRQQTGQDQNSFITDPKLYDECSYQIASATLDNQGTPIAEVTEDIEGNARSLTTPDIGAFEYDALPLDVGIADITVAESPFPAGTQNIQVELRNYGSETLQAVDIHLEATNNAKIFQSWTGELASNESIKVDIGEVNFAINTNHTLTAWTEIPNGQSAVYTVNDTSRITDIYAGLGGTYTIGADARDFTTFNETIVNLEEGGMLAPIEFQVQSGVYEEQLLFSQAINGQNPDWFITYRSEAQDSSQVVVQHETTDQNHNYVLQLSNQIAIHFHQLTFKATHPEWDRVLITNPGGSIQLTNNQFIAHPTPHLTQPSEVALLRSSFEEFLFSDNYVLNGETGVFLFPSFAATISPKVIKNTLRGQTNTAIDAAEFNGAIISGNDMRGEFERGINIGSSSYQVDGNTILGNATHFGILVQSHASESDIFNNYINIQHPENCTGIRFNGSHTGLIAYNTVVTTGVASEDCALRLAFVPSASRILNNNFINEGVGTAVYYAQAEDFMNSEVDHNNYWSANSTTPISVEGEFLTLQGWQENSDFDLQSLNVNPHFVQTDDPQPTNTALNAAAMSLTEVDVDIRQQNRDVLIPDIGAVEFSFADALAIQNLTLELTCIDDNPVLVVTNSFTDLPNLTIEKSKDGQHWETVKKGQWEGNNYQISNVADQANYYRLIHQKSGIKAYTEIIYNSCQGEFIQVNPNPVFDILNIHLAITEAPNGVLILQDNIGRVVKQLPIDQKDIKLSVEGLPAGIYFVCAQTPFIDFNKKIVVMK